MLVTELEFEDFDLYRIGNSLEITGVLYGNSIDENVLIALPDSHIRGERFEIMMPNMNEWEHILRQSDLKEVLLIGKNRDKKVILRKSTRQIEQKVMWTVFRRDKYTCRYCGNNKTPLTVDHMVLWEEGGPTIPMNLLSSCKVCNNRRGSMQYEDWLQDPYYLDNAKNLTEGICNLNVRVVENIPKIRGEFLRTMKRGR